MSSLLNDSVDTSSLDKPSEPDPSSSEKYSEEMHIVSKILDVKAFPREKILKYRVRWEGYTAADDTWQTEDSLTENRLVEKSLEQFKKHHMIKLRKQEALLTDSSPKKKKERRKIYDYVPDEKPNRTDLTTPRELDENDEFFGGVAGNVKGETKKLFDPTHKNTASELLLAQLATNGRITRRIMKDILPGESSGSQNESSRCLPSSSKSNMSASQAKNCQKRPAPRNKRTVIKAKSAKLNEDPLVLEDDTDINDSSEIPGLSKDNSSASSLGEDSRDKCKKDGSHKRTVIKAKSVKLNEDPLVLEDDTDINDSSEITGLSRNNSSASSIGEDSLDKCKKDGSHIMKEDQSISQSSSSKKKREPRKTWDYVLDEKPNRTDLTTPCELDKNDEFFGGVAGNVKGETKKLFDPTHKNTPSELLLAQLATNGRITRRIMKDMLPVESSGIRKESCSSSSSSKIKLVVTDDKSAVTKPVSANMKKKITAKSVKPNSDYSSLKNDIETNCLTEIALSNGNDSAASSSGIKKESYRPAPPLSPIINVIQSGTKSPITLPASAKEGNEPPRGWIIEDDSIFENEYPVLMNTTEERSINEDVSSHSNYGVSNCQELGDSGVIYNDRAISKQAKKKLNPENFKFGKDYIKLFTDKSVCIHSVNALFKNLSVVQLHCVVQWKEEGTGYSLLHWVGANMTCDNAHKADQLAHLLCTISKEAFKDSQSIVRFRDAKKNTALHLAVEKSHDCSVIVLLSYRSPLNFANIQQKTPLMLAYENKNEHILKMLLRAGADFSYLLSEELKKPTELRVGPLDAIIHHSDAVRKLFRDSRKGMLNSFKEVKRYRSTIQLGLVQEGPILKFQLLHEECKLPPADYGYILALHICCFEGTDVTQWTARCLSGLKLRGRPIFNGTSLTYGAAQNLSLPTFYFVDPVVGVNNLELHITPSGINYDIIGCQLVLVRNAADE